MLKDKYPGRPGVSWSNQVGLTGNWWRGFAGYFHQHRTDKLLHLLVISTQKQHQPNRDINQYVGGLINQTIDQWLAEECQDLFR